MSTGGHAGSSQLVSRYTHSSRGGGTVMSETTLYERLGGYDAISAVANDLLGRLQADSQLARYWQHRGEDGIGREKQLLIDFLCSSAGGPLYYTGREMRTSHKGMQISEIDWSTFLGHLNATLDAFEVPRAERDDVIAFVQSTKPDIVEA
jgi:hemoglobin